ncbi:hypothetical protein [[Flexibacter] sp. ATCC 35208]|uniref:hypothetical protein n=1 Tax=[Flexibacter] sp. ATCC 35208 TaxID=1936242 RepID=UPI001F419322|nr:hypothetical protein [[Flexibacter] sp. ATCC 35208]
MANLYAMSRIYLFLCLLLPCLTYAQDTPIVMHLWPNGAPGYENRKNEPEIAKDYYVKNIHNPSITVYLPPKEKATGAAVVIAQVVASGYWFIILKASILRNT